jgi:hypothetical protein
MPASNRNHVQVVRCKGCKRCVPISVEAVIGSVTVACPSAGAAFPHRVYGSLLRTAVLGSDARASGETVMEDRGAADKTAGIVAVVAGLIAAVKLSWVESREIQNRSPRVRSIISESVTIARMVIEASKAKE